MSMIPNLCFYPAIDLDHELEATSFKDLISKSSLAPRPQQGGARCNHEATIHFKWKKL